MPKVKSQKSKFKFFTGFTLIEVLVVIAIIGILAAIGVNAYDVARKQTRDARRKSDLKQIQNALEAYFNNTGIYPAGSAGSDRACWTGGSTDSSSLSSCPLNNLIVAGLMKKIPYDPGRNGYTSATGGCGTAQLYSYSSDGNTYTIAAVEEAKGASSCNVNCGSWWNGSQYQFCLFNP